MKLPKELQGRTVCEVFLQSFNGDCPVFSTTPRWSGQDPHFLLFSQSGDLLGITADRPGPTSNLNGGLFHPATWAETSEVDDRIAEAEDLLKRLQEYLFDAKQKGIWLDPSERDAVIAKGIKLAEMVAGLKQHRARGGSE